MSPPASRVQRWLLGTPEEEPASAPALDAADLPPLPTRVPDPLRPQVRGLPGDVHSLRRRQVLGDGPGGTHASPVDRSLPAVLTAWQEPAQAALMGIRDELDGFVSALVSTSNGAVLASLGLDHDAAATLAVATSTMAEGLGVPGSALDLIAVKLTTDDAVVCVSTSVEGERLTLRVTASGTALGIIMHRAQHAAHVVSASSGATST